MQLLSVKELSNKRESESLKDIERTKLTKEQLNFVTKSLEDAEAKFNLALANQHIRWKQEEEEAVKRIEELNKEIKELEVKKTSILVPIEEREKKSYALFAEAEKLHQELIEQKNINNDEKIKTDETCRLLEEKLDKVSEKEVELDQREKEIIVKERAIEAQRTMIKDISAELSIKLNNLN